MNEPRCAVGGTVALLTERQTPSVVMTTGGEDNGVLCPSQLGSGDDDETMARDKTAESCGERDAANKLMGGGEVVPGSAVCICFQRIKLILRSSYIVFLH